MSGSRSSLVVLHEPLAYINPSCSWLLNQALAVAPGELPVEVAFLRCVTPQLRQSAGVVLLHGLRLSTEQIACRA